MSTFRTLCLAGVMAGVAAAAAAQTVAAPVQPVPRPGSYDGTAMPPVMDNRIVVHALLDQFEGRVGGGQNAFRWDGQAWAGTDYDKLWLKSEGFLFGNGRVEDGQQEFLYDRAISTYFDLQAGLRADIDSATGRNWAAFGIQGLAPLFFDLEATAYLSDRGHAAARLVAPYDLLLTQRLILQPEAELNFYSKADPAVVLARDFPTSMPVCGCATRSAASSRPISASLMLESLARPRPWRARRARVRARYSSCPA